MNDMLSAAEIDTFFDQAGQARTTALQNVEAPADHKVTVTQSPTQQTEV
jgi:hypothetical protein